MSSLRSGQVSRYHILKPEWLHRSFQGLSQSYILFILIRTLSDLSLIVEVYYWFLVGLCSWFTTQFFSFFDWVDLYSTPSDVRRKQWSFPINILFVPFAFGECYEVAFRILNDTFTSLKAKGIKLPLT